MNKNLFRKIYKQLIERAKMENRFKNNGIYYEKHHILPDFMFKYRKRKGPCGHLVGDPNNTKNLVLLTAREHFIAHILLYKIYKNTKYEYQTGSALTFFISHILKNKKHPRYNDSILNSKKYEKYRLLGLDSISKARKGKMPAKDIKTGKSVGSVPIDHPKVKCGEWVHHTKGRKASKKELDNRPSDKGENNNNYKKLTIEMENNFLRTFEKIKDSDNIIKSSYFYKEYNFITENKRNKISEVFIKNKFGNFSNFLEYINNKYNKNYLYLGAYYRRRTP
ncbi:MAG: HNH homing endonuclease [Caudoviricetes sp.]|nr:MAG: HNH homing endonuclease [Caudoviricetes sp.]